MQLKDKTVIITGASSGIGAAAALLFAKEGAKLVLGARREKELMSIMGQINQSNGNAICLVAKQHNGQQPLHIQNRCRDPARHHSSKLIVSGELPQNNFATLKEICLDGSIRPAIRLL